MANLLPCGFAVTSASGEIRLLNKFLVNLLGLQESVVLEHCYLTDLMPMGVRMYFETHIYPLLESQGIVEEISIELSRSDHTTVPVLMNALVVKSDIKHRDSVQFTFFDISQRRKYEKELLLASQQHEQLIEKLMTINGQYRQITDELERKTAQTQKDNDYYRSIIENNSFYFIKTDLQGNYTYLNPWYCQALGLRASDWLGKNALVHIHPDDHPVCIQTVSKCRQEPNVSHTVVLRKPGITGLLYNQWEFRLFTDQAGNAIEFICIGQEITPLYKKQQELELLANVTAEQNRRLVNFTYIISHNIRSHVANIKGIIQVNEFDAEIDDRRALTLIAGSVARLDDTIHNLNDIITLQGTSSLPLSKISLQTEIDGVLQSIRLSLDEAGAKVEFLGFQDEVILTNAAYFESILLNLVTNSIRYASPQRPLLISFSLEKSAGSVRLGVSDNGLGMDLATYGDQLFGMYSTFHGNKEAKGLGLYIVKTQIEALGGSIEVKSAPGMGSTFYLNFPVPVNTAG